MEALTVAAVQMNVESGEKKRNIQTARNLMSSTKDEVSFFLLPELFTTGYALKRAGEWAEPIPGPTTDILAELAVSFRSYLIGSILEAVERSKPKNTCIVLDPGGKIVAKYSKVHLFKLAQEHVFLSPGSSLTVFESSFGKMGLVICYDLRFPELPRSLALLGARILFVPAEWPNPRRDPWRTLVRARAIENQLFVAGANRVGYDGEDDFFGNSMIVDPYGNIISEGGETEGLVLSKLDLSQIEKARAQMTCYDDRRPSLYKLISALSN